MCIVKVSTIPDAPDSPGRQLAFPVLLEHIHITQLTPCGDVDPICSVEGVLGVELLLVSSHALLLLTLADAGVVHQLVCPLHNLCAHLWGIQLLVLSHRCTSHRTGYCLQPLVAILDYCIVPMPVSFTRPVNDAAAGEGISHSSCEF